eukprot:97312-Chlamydomonas_euryale.AAC.1
MQFPHLPCPFLPPQPALLQGLPGRSNKKHLASSLQRQRLSKKSSAVRKEDRVVAEGRPEQPTAVVSMGETVHSSPPPPRGVLVRAIRPSNKTMAPTLLLLRTL